jgi:uncharacterized glyoxalase superfamily protein PhnB
VFLKRLFAFSSNDEGENKMNTTFGVSNIAAAIRGAVRAGAVQEPVEENIAAMHGGGPIAKVRDPFGFSWYICKSPIHVITHGL